MTDAHVTDAETIGTVPHQRRFMWRLTKVVLAGIVTAGTTFGCGVELEGHGATEESERVTGARVSALVSTPYNWKNVAIGGGGFVTGIVFSPALSNLAYARTDVGGFYRWDGATNRWTALNDSTPMAEGNLFGGESIAPDPVDPNIVYAAAGMYQTAGNGVILKSTNRGSTWTVINIGLPMGGNDLGRGMGERLAVDPNNNQVLYFGSRTSGLWKSTDGAATWSRVTAFPVTGDATYGLPVVVFDKRNGTAAGSPRIYVARASKSAGSNLYISNDHGATWSLVPGGPSGLMVHHAAVASDGTFWAAYSSDYGPFNTGGGTLTGRIYKRTAGGTWTNVTPPSTNWGGMAGGLSVDPQNSQRVVVSTLDWYAPDRLLRTTNGGASWGVIAQPPTSWNANGSTYDVQGAQYWLSGVTRIGTNATNWVEAVAINPFNANHAMYGTGAGIWSSTNINGATGSSGQGVVWRFHDQGLEETVPLHLVPAVKGAFLGAIGDLGGMRNTNLDAYSSTGRYINPTHSNVNALDYAETNANFVVRVGNSGSIASDVAYSTNNGVSWTPCPRAPTGYTTANQMGSVAVSADGARFVVAPNAGRGSPAFTTNRCSTWTTSTGLPSGARLAADRVNASHFYATSGGTLYLSTNGGQSFTTVGSFTGSGAPRAAFGQANEIWVAGNGGPLYRFTGTSASRTEITSVSAAWGVGFGKAAAGLTHPAVFIIGVVDGQYGFFRSDDGAGAVWTRINDDAHQYGWLQNNYIAGDENVFGRVYLTTAGRGYVYGDPL